MMTLRKILAGCTLLAGFAVAGLVGGSGTAWATSPVTASLDISTTVDATCAMSSAPVVLSDYYASATQDLTGTGTINYTCSDGTTTASISLDQGATSGGTITQRLMAGPSSDTLQYNIYQGAGETTLWGDGTTGGTAYSDVNDTDSITYYIDVPKGQFVTPGAYSDTVTASLSF